MAFTDWLDTINFIILYLSVVDFSSEKYIGPTGHRYSCYQQRRYSEDADGETPTRNQI